MKFIIFPSFLYKLDITVFFEGGVQADSEFLVTILDFQSLLNDESILNLTLSVGAAVQVDGDTVTCVANNCDDDNQLACVIDLGKDADNTGQQIVDCYLDGNSITDCVSALNIIDADQLDGCIKDKAKSLLLATRDAMQKSSPQITEYPSIMVNNAYDPCVSQAAFDDFTNTICGMLQSGRGDGACPTSASNAP